MSLNTYGRRSRGVQIIDLHGLDYIEAEKKISHTFRYKPATKSKPAIKETIQDIVTRILLKRRES